MQGNYFIDIVLFVYYLSPYFIIWGIIVLSCCLSAFAYQHFVTRQLEFLYLEYSYFLFYRWKKISKSTNVSVILYPYISAIYSRYNVCLTIVIYFTISINIQNNYTVTLTPFTLPLTCIEKGKCGVAMLRCKNLKLCQTSTLSYMILTIYFLVISLS